MQPVIALAPLAGYTTADFRALCTRRGADLVYSEMVSARGLVYESERSEELLRRHPDERGLIVQLFADDPDILHRAVLLLPDMVVADGVDLNMGCPVKKIAKAGAGAVLMKDPGLSRALIRAARQASRVPVSIKIRLGWAPNLPAARTFIDMAAEEGCSHVVVHARWATQLYSGKPDFAALAEAVRGAGLPVLANGDIATADDAARVLEQTGCAGVALGRGALGRPDVFAEVRARLRPGDPAPEVIPDSLARRVEVARFLLREALAAAQGPGAPPHIWLRGHLMYLLKGFPRAAQSRVRILSCSSAPELDSALRELVEPMAS